MRVGFVGLGIMGAPMARNALKAGFAVTVTNRTFERAKPLGEQGATIVRTPREVAERSDVVVTMVTSSPDVEAVTFGPDGIAAGAHDGLLVVDMSTISPAASRDIAKRAAANKPPFRTLDAPVSGGEVGAVEARLAIMIGGEAEDVKRAMPLFEALGKTIVHIGAHGAGQACKLANQIAVALNNLGVSEALVFAKAQGIDLERTRQVIAGGAGSSWAMQNYAPKMLAGDFRPGFMVDLQQKDLRLILDNAYGDHVSLPGTALVHALYTAVQKDGGGREGNHALLKAIERLSGIEARQR
ncbi:MAG TPA: NAD(P)-dependent oxidoreductase [Candidatus Limnocylindria bacterium]|jgi:3-hydroxyisobutyrate dehydrogenase|nr:NAD(P)-dependent oxidoreductase [Candidatus Limnocylindria bacterium]